MMKTSTKLFAALALASAAGVASAQSLPAEGYLYSKVYREYMTLNENKVESYLFDQNRMPASLWNFENISSGVVAIKNHSTNKYIGALTAWEKSPEGVDAPYHYTWSTGTDSQGKTFFSFQDPTFPQGANYGHLHAKGADAPRVVAWEHGNSAEASRWYTVTQQQLEQYNEDLAAAVALTKKVLPYVTPVYNRVEDRPLISSGAQFDTNAKEPTEGSFDNLLDNNPATHFHSTWSGTVPPAPHNLQVFIENPEELKTFEVAYQARVSSGYYNNRPTHIKIYGGTGTKGNVVWQTTPFAELKAGTDIDKNDVNGIGGKTGTFQFEADQAYTAFKFDVIATNTNTTFFTYGDFQLYPTKLGDPKPRIEKTQLLTKAEQLWSDMVEPTEGSIAGLIDDNPSTFFHSTWSSTIAGPHNLMWKFSNPEGLTEFKVDYVARNVKNRPSEMMIYGGKVQEDSSVVWEEEAFQTLVAPSNNYVANVNGIGGQSGSFTIVADKAYDAFKMEATKRVSGTAEDNNPFFTYAEFHMYTAKVLDPLPTANAAQMQAIEDALKAAAAAHPCDNVVPITNNIYTALTPFDAGNVLAISRIMLKIDKIKAAAEGLRAKQNANAKIVNGMNAMNPQATKELVKNNNIDEGLVAKIEKDIENLEKEVAALNAATHPSQFSAIQEKIDEILNRINYTHDILDSSRNRFSTWKDNRPYAVNWNMDTNLPVTHKNRKLNGLEFTTTQDGLQELPIETSTVYTDLSAQEIEVEAGDSLTVAALYQGAYMHGYLYIDLNNDKTFSTQYVTEGQPGQELVSYSYYDANGDDKGSNSKAQDASMNSVADGKIVLPTIVVPKEAGNYRLRFKIDWNNVDPAGQYGFRYGGNYIDTNGGYIVDVTLKVKGNVTGIGTLSTRKDAPVFDLSGRCVKSPAKGGLYIQNGKKVVL